MPLLDDRNKEISERFDLLGDSFSQCDYLMTLGMSRPTVPQIRTDQYRIGGCKTAIWIRTGLSDQTVLFETDSDSLLVKGVLSLFDELYAGASAEEIRKYPPLFLDHISEDVIYREIKTNGLQKCYLKMQL